MIHEQDRQTVIDHAEKALSGEVPPPLEHRILHKDGSVRWIKNTSVPPATNKEDCRLRWPRERHHRAASGSNSV